MDAISCFYLEVEEIQQVCLEVESEGSRGPGTSGGSTSIQCDDDLSVLGVEFGVGKRVEKKMGISSQKTVIWSETPMVLTW